MLGAKENRFACDFIYVQVSHKTSINTNNRNIMFCLIIKFKTFQIFAVIKIPEMFKYSVFLHQL